MNMSEFVAANWEAMVVAAGFVLIYELLVVLPLRLRINRVANEHRSMAQAVQEATATSVRLAPISRRQGAELARLDERVGQLELVGGGRPYAQAISLAEQGEEPDRLVSCYGLTEGEAKLVSLLHGREGLEAADP